MVSREPVCRRGLCADNSRAHWAASSTPGASYWAGLARGGGSGATRKGRGSVGLSVQLALDSQIPWLFIQHTIILDYFSLYIHFDIISL